MEAEILCREAMQRGDIGTVEKFIEDPTFDCGFRNNLLIRWASTCGYLKIVRILLSRKEVKPHIWRNRPITMASRYNQLEVVKYLLNDTRVTEWSGHYLALDEGIRKKNWAICVVSILSGGDELETLGDATAACDFPLLLRFQQDRIVSKAIIRWFPDKYKLQVALLWFCIVKRGWKGHFKYLIPELSKIIIQY